jgi:hypothetical protein
MIRINPGLLFRYTGSRSVQRLFLDFGMQKGMKYPGIRYIEICKPMMKTARIVLKKRAMMRLNVTGCRVCI